MTEPLDTSPIVVEKLFAADIEKVWEAISVHEQMIKWYFNMIPAFEARVGFETIFDVHARDDVYYKHLWKVTEVVATGAKRRLVYDWLIGGYEGCASWVVWELDQTAEGMQLCNFVIVLDLVVNLLLIHVSLFLHFFYVNFFITCITELTLRHEVPP
jgi:uncharacterized protein YndB with AHSA1/START domain